MPIGLPLALPAAAVVLGITRGWHFVLPQWGWVEIVVLTVIVVAIAPVVASYRRVRSVGDRIGEPLKPPPSALGTRLGRGSGAHPQIHRIRISSGAGTHLGGVGRHVGGLGHREADSTRRHVSVDSLAYPQPTPSLPRQQKSFCSERLLFPLR